MRVSARSFLKTWLLAVAVAACLALASATARAQDDDPPAEAGRLSSISGNVSIQPAGANDWGQAYPNLPLGPGDRIFTDSDGRAEVQVGQTYFRVGPNSDVTFIEASSDSLTFGVAQGRVHVRTMGLWPEQSLYVQTPSGSTTVTQQADFRVDVLPDQNAAVFTDFFGNVYVSGAGGLGLNTSQGQSLELIGTNPVYPEWLAPAYPDDLDRWSEGRDQQITRAMAYRYVSSEMPGGSDLDASGEWQPGTEYGNIWFPRVDAGWQPYHNGHWVNHEPWGFVWVEDEPWGYAPFHYGRWVNYHGRWGWIPGSPAAHPVWSPALVVFAGGIHIGGGGVSVWFPLGPGEPYRPWYHASPRYVNQVNITNIQESRVVHVQNTYVNVTNVTNNTTINNITYVNRTVGATAMRQEDMASGRPVAQAAVKVDPQQLAHAQVLERPQVVPNKTAMMARPPARPVPVAAARPVLINAQGKIAPAQPHAQAVEPPVRPTVAPKPLPGRTVVAAPPNAKQPPPRPAAIAAQPAAQPAARPAVQPSPAPQPAPQPATRPGNQPVAQPPARPAPQPTPQPAAKPVPEPAPQPAPRPQVNPAPAPQPQVRPTPQPQPQDRPTHPAPQAAPQPAPKPQVNPAERPAPPPPQPQSRPAPLPENRPEARPARPAPSPPAQTRPAQPEPRPNAQPEAKPAPKPAPPPQKDNKNEKEKKDEQKPQR